MLYKSNISDSGVALGYHNECGSAEGMKLKAEKPEVNQVFTLGRTSHQNVIQVHENKQQVAQNTVHELLKSLGGVFQPKGHVEELKQTKRTYDNCLGILDFFAN